MNPTSWRQPLRVDGPKASQRSMITHEIHFCTDQAKTHREVRFWFDLSYDATRMHRQILRITFCCFLFVFCRKVLPWVLVYKMAGFKTRATLSTAYCDVGMICAHKTATRVDVTSAHMVIHCFVYYLCWKWLIIAWHNLYRWRLGMLLTCDMKCDSEIWHANFYEVRANIFRVI